MSKAFFKIPRIPTLREGAKPYYDLVRKHGRSRRAMVAFICGIGGYSDGYERFAVSFDVKAHYADMDAGHLWSVATKETDHSSAYDAMTATEKHYMEQAFRATCKTHENDLFNWGIEEAREQWEDSDMPHETFYSERVEWEWEFRGRQGGHLVMTSCAGLSMRHSEELLFDDLNAKDGGAFIIDTDTVRRIFLICVQMSVEMTNAKASAEVEYRAAWRVWCMAEGDAEEAQRIHEEREELNGHAAAIRAALVDSADPEQREAFEKICKIAGLNIEED